jgi:hypothetical protein
MIALLIWSVASVVTHFFAKNRMSIALARLSHQVRASVLLFVAYMFVIAPWAALLLLRALCECVKKVCRRFIPSPHRMGECHLTSQPAHADHFLQHI